MTEMEYLFSCTRNLTFYVQWMFVLFALTHCLASEHYTIYRDFQVSFPKDQFKIPTSVCGLQANCDSFQAKKTDKTCQCSCGLNGGKRSTFGLYNGTWSCVYDKGLRLREGCSLLLHSELSDSAITILHSGVAVRMRLPKYHYTIDENSARYQDCNGKWIPIINAAKKFQYHYSNRIGYYLLVLEELNGQRFSYLHGTLIKLGFDFSYSAAGIYEKDCLLFKLSGTLSCPKITRAQTSGIKPFEPTSTSVFTTPVIIHPTTSIVSTPTRITKSTTANSRRKTVVTGTRRSTVQQSSRELVEAQAINPSQAFQAVASSPAIQTVFPGNEDRREDGSDGRMFAIIGGVAATVFVVVATLAAVIAIRRKRNKQNNESMPRNKSSLHLSKDYGKSNESLISIQSDASNCTTLDVSLDKSNFECQPKLVSTARSQIPVHVPKEDKVKNCQNINENIPEQKTSPVYAKVDKEDKTCATKEDHMETANKNVSDQENTASGCYESLRRSRSQSYQGLTHHVEFLPSAEYAYARYDGSGNVQSETHAPIYNVLEGPDPNSSDNKWACNIDRTNTRWLTSGNEEDLAHVYETPDGSEANVHDEVYSTIDETCFNVPGEASPQSPVYVELEGFTPGEIEI